MNHQSLKVLKAKELMMGIPSIGQLDLYEACVLGKHACTLGSLWTMHTESLGGNKYFVLLADDFYRMTWIRFIKSKNHAFETFLKFQVLVERQT